MPKSTADEVIVPRIRRLAIVPPAATPPDRGESLPVRSLHLNEAPFPPAPAVIAAMQQAAAGLNRYPDHDGAELIAELARRTGAPAETIVIGSGSNELLYASADIALDPGDEAVAPVPGFPTYAKTISLRGATHVGAPVRADGVVDVAATLAAVTDRTRLVFVATPHNPTGGLMGAGEIEHLVRALPDHLLLHFDEAYYEFGRHAGAAESLPLIARRRGPWIVTRSFSKAYGLAGARVGYGITSDRALADAYRKIRVNFSVNAVALAAARTALGETDHLARLLDHTAAERQRLSRGLAELGLKPLPSAANFVSVLTPAPARLAAALAERNVFVLPFPWPGTEGALRITIGSQADTDAVLNGLRDALASR
ncbi:pyridoxal phosphate-dependent aminotransferase [Phreatobacter sp. AB_2022a]|uniref:pyridoxal phosphate-dependent aminotransferase n=1 Tax=Phreatobacter sp. AB_2022a TaxID=3003134 RepID=UPI00228764F8|nr:histidinol-phosphate transaminase [Phreatobacter sp. AB_2022a]MCZ0736318.1 histidinol-phosphate transaminase [Phreatobacter sp. AB_2022a]